MSQYLSTKTIEDVYEQARRRDFWGEWKAERAFVLDFVVSVYGAVGLPVGLFARQVGVQPQTVRLWLRRAGNIPSPKVMARIVKLYEENPGGEPVSSAPRGDGSTGQRPEEG
jgi:hypothetical protein